MRIHSHSSLGSFENCPRQYWYQYIGKPPVERVDTIEAFLGTCVHETLEILYRLRLRGRVLSQKYSPCQVERASAQRPGVGSLVPETTLVLSSPRGDFASQISTYSS